MADLEPLVVKLIGDASVYNKILKTAQADVTKAAKVMTEAARIAEARLNETMRRGAQITAAMRTPTENYRKELAELNRILKAGGFTQETYNRALAELRQTLPSVQKAQEASNRAAAESKRIMDGMITPQQHHSRRVLELGNYLKAGRITQAAYNAEVEKSRKTLPSVIKAEEAAAKAQDHFNDEMERGKKVMGSLLTPVERYQQTVQDLNQLLRMGAINYKTYSMGIAQASQQLPVVEKAQRKYNETVDRARVLTEQLRTPYQQYRIQQRELNKLLKDGHITQATYSRGIEKLRKDFDRLGPALQNASTHLRTISGGMRSFGGSLRGAGMLSSLFITAPLTAFATAGVQAFSAFDEAMTYSLSIAENVTPKMRKEMEDLATTMSEKSKFSATELAQAYYELISAGLDVQTSMKSLDTVNKFAIAGNMNLASSVKQLAKATAAMGLAGKTADETAHGMLKVANVLVQAANMTTGSIEDMTTALVNGAAPQARLLGMNIEDTTAVLMKYIQVGESAAETSSHFAIGMRLLGTAASEHKDFWKQQKLELYDVNGQMRKFTDILRDMQKIYLKLTPQGRVPFLKSLGFEALQQRAINPLLASSDAADQIDEWSKKLERMDALEKVANKQMESFSNQMKAFRNVVQNVSMEVAEILLPYIKQLITYIKVGITVWRELSQEGKIFTVAVGAIAAAIGPVLIAFGTLLAMAGSVVGALAGVAAAIAAIGLPVAAVVAAVAILAGAIAGVVAYSVAMSMWPEETKKVLTVVERMFNAFLGFMDGLFDQIFTKVMVGHFIDGALKLLQYVSPFAAALKKALDLNDPAAANQAAEEWAKTVQAAFDRGMGRLDLKKALTNILDQELGFKIGTGSLTEKVKTAMSEVEQSFKDAQERMSMMGQDIPVGQFTALSSKLDEVNKKFKEQIAIEQEQARRGYEKVNAMSSAQKELMHLELKLGQERQDIMDKYIKASQELAQKTSLTIGGEQDLMKAMDELDQRMNIAVGDFDRLTKSHLDLARSQAEVLAKFEKERQKFDQLKAIADKDPINHFAKQSKLLTEAFNKGDITAKHYQKELRELRNQMMKEYKIDFKVGGVEALEAGTARTQQAIEDFVFAQREAMRNPLTGLQGAAPPPTVVKQNRRGMELARRASEGGVAGRRQREIKLRASRVLERELAEQRRRDPDAFFGRNKVEPITPSVNQVATNSMGSRMSELEGKSDSELLKRIAAATEVTAKKKNQTLEPANLGM